MDVVNVMKSSVISGICIGIAASVTASNQRKNKQQ
jgi:hypothetical protein